MWCIISIPILTSAKTTDVIILAHFRVRKYVHLVVAKKHVMHSTDI